MPPQKPPQGKEDASSADAERREKIDALMLRRTALSESEIALFDEEFRKIYDEHYDRVWRVLMRKGVPEAALSDLTQEVFAKWLCHVRDHGFEDSIKKHLDRIAAG